MSRRVFRTFRKPAFREELVMLQNDNQAAEITTEESPERSASKSPIPSVKTGQGARRSRHGAGGKRALRAWTDDDVRAAISGTLSSNVVPSLSAFHHDDGRVAATSKTPLPLDDLTVDQFTHSLLDGDHGAAAGLFEDLRLAGFSWAQLATDLAVPAAMRMGAMWSSDAADFASVSLGTSLIHRILNHDFQRSFAGLTAQVASGERSNSVVVASFSDDQHILGATLLERFFQIARWQVYSAIGCRPQDLIALVANQDVDVVCLTLTNRVDSEAMGEMIGALRSQARNPELKVIAGGLQVMIDPALTKAIGADGSAKDFDSAIDLALRLVTTDKK